MGHRVKKPAIQPYYVTTADYKEAQQLDQGIGDLDAAPERFILEQLRRLREIGVELPHDFASSHKVKVSCHFDFELASSTTKLQHDETHKEHKSAPKLFAVASARQKPSAASTKLKETPTSSWSTVQRFQKKLRTRFPAEEKTPSVIAIFKRLHEASRQGNRSQMNKLCGEIDRECQRLAGNKQKKKEEKEKNITKNKLQRKAKKIKKKKNLEMQHAKKRDHVAMH